MSDKRKLSLNGKIIIALSLGLLVGMITGDSRVSEFMKDVIVFGVFNVIGQVFLKMLSMIVLPVVLVSLISGFVSIGNLNRMSKLAGKTVGYFLITTIIAIILGISFAYIFEPGSGFNLTGKILSEEKLPTISKIIIDIIPTNPFMAMQSNIMLQLIMFTALIGVSMSILGKKVKNTINIIQQLNKLILKMVNMVMAFAPIGVFALVINVFAKEGFDAFVPMLRYMGVMVLVLAVHTIFSYGSVLTILGLNKKMFIKKFKSVFLTGFATASSNATLPITMSMVQYKCGVSHKITSAVVPLGVTINKNGTAIMQAVASIFIAQAYGVELSLASMLTLSVFIFISSIGTAGIPSAGMITLPLILTSVGLPIDGVATVVVVDKLLDMLRTTVNLAGNSVGALLIAKGDNNLNMDTYNDPKAAVGEEKTIGEFGQEISINKEFINKIQEEKVTTFSE